MIYFNSFYFYIFYHNDCAVFYSKNDKKMYILQLQERETKQLKEYTGKLEEINQK